MKRVFIEAYFRKNLGDDMFVCSLLRSFPNVKFFAEIPKKYGRAFLNEANIELLYEVNRANLIRRLKKVLRSFSYDAVVKIGGSIFMQKKVIANDKTKKAAPQWIKKFAYRNRFVIGANYGPYFTQEFLEASWADLACHKGVSLRDNWSYNLFCQLGNTQVAPDVLFGYPGYPYYQKGNGVGISVIDPGKKQFIGEHQDQYYEIMANVSDLFLSKGVPVTLYGFCSAEGDMEAIEAIKEKMHYKQQVNVCAYDGEIDAFLNSLNACEYIIATRFHAMIIGFVLGKQVLPVIYSQKQTNVLNDMNYLGGIWDLLHGELLDAEDVYQRCIEAPVIEGMEEYCAKSSVHFMQLQKYLDGIRT